MEKQDVLVRNNVTLHGKGSRALVFAHGFGCDKHMWTDVSTQFEEDYRTILFDHVGAGESDLAAYDSRKYASLAGYAQDLVEIGEALDLSDAVIVGHSVSSMIGALAAIARPQMFSELVMVGPSPRYIDDGDYTGGFTREQIDELLIFLEENHLGWSAALAPQIMGNADRPELGDRLTKSFCATDPEIAREFAGVTFYSDNREDLPKIPVRTLVLQCQQDIIAPEAVGEYVHAKVPHSEYILLDATGHCPNLSAPEEVTRAIRDFLAPSR
ncbi:alpha/beta fold hydrolase [Sphingopyxis sp. JAI108]|uniref:alpha/beta fold hydrolase n=1 Tax=Sphingopyxis sp. JAI108 TaxID=2723060 RepID=UPI0015CD5AD0|nr:alpha/beta hydrolase [Sphingopyxis sp. JAI108]NYF33500.1 sigma-B regulation protein RsbQ [Sphingopyxis sp. JAI108]